MSKSKTNALDALRALIAERQQYDQWISTLESKRDGTVEHVFNRVYSDYKSRLDRVVGDIRGHAEELQLSIAALSSRLGEVAKEEEAKRDEMSEAELRAAVGEYDVGQWESMQADARRQLDKIGGDRASLEAQLAELESIRKLSEVTALPGDTAPPVSTSQTEPVNAEPARAEPPKSETPRAEQQELVPPVPVTEPKVEGHTTFVRADRAEEPVSPKKFSDAGWPARDIVEQPPVASASSDATPAKPARQPGLGMFRNSAGAIGEQPGERTAQRSVEEAAVSEQAPAAAVQAPAQTFSSNIDSSVAAPRPSATPVAPPPTPTPPRKKRDTPSGKDAQISSGFSKPVRTPADARPEVNKTLKCPECGTPNYPTEWYCERCGGELATM